jgi:hypothetical protein
MSVFLLAAMLPIAGLLALVIAWPRLSEQRGNGRLSLEAFGTALVGIALVWAAWVVLWLVEQRW